MPQYTNISDVPLSLAVFLASDNYDHNDDPNTISATTLLKPVRQVILAARVQTEDGAVDLGAMLSSRMGSAIHDGIERAWKDNYVPAMQLLGYPRKLIERVVVNPSEGTDLTDLHPVYLENRASKKVGKYTITGKYDFVGDGRLEDFKSTSVWTAINKSNDDYYVWQGSIYRWLSPKIITRDEMAIQWIFTDWSKSQARGNPSYPQSRHVQKIFHLKSIPETQSFVERQVHLLDSLWDAPEEKLPYCTDTELWRSEPRYKYYKNPASLGRSTKNFDTHQDAMLRYIEDGSVGLVKEVPGQVKACRYCPAFLACTQKDAYIANGDLTLD